MRPQGARTTQSRMISTLAQQRSSDMTSTELRQLEAEAEVIVELLKEEDSTTGTPIGHTSQDLVDSAFESRFSVSHWIECIQTCPYISPRTYRSSIALPKGSVFSKTHYRSAGLSPESTHAYFLGSKELVVYQLPTTITNQTGRIAFRQRCTGSEYKEAALTERFLVILREGPGDSMEVFDYRSNGEDVQMVAKETFEARSNEHQWRPDCLAVHEKSDGACIAIGGRGAVSSAIRIYQLDTKGEKVSFSKHITQFNRTKPDPLVRDFLKTIDFSEDGGSLTCVTNNNVVLVWVLPNQGQSLQTLSRISKKYNPEIKARGVTSASLFHTPSGNSYILCTTSPSSERSRYGGEWSYISPILPLPATIPPQLDHSLWRLRECKAILTGAVSPSSNLIALLEETGRVLLMPLVAEASGGLSSEDPVFLDVRLAEQQKASSTSLRFCHVGHNLCLVGVDTKGTIIRKYFEDEAHSLSLSSTDASEGSRHKSTGWNHHRSKS